jgi:hypothetical protein
MDDSDLMKIDSSPHSGLVLGHFSRLRFTTGELLAHIEQNGRYRCSTNYEAYALKIAIRTGDLILVSLDGNKNPIPPIHVVNGSFTACDNLRI